MEDRRSEQFRDDLPPPERSLGRLVRRWLFLYGSADPEGAMELTEEAILKNALTEVEQREIALRVMDSTIKDMRLVLEVLGENRIPDRFRSLVPADAEDDFELPTLISDFYLGNAVSIATLLEMADFIDSHSQTVSVANIHRFSDDYQWLLDEFAGLLDDRFRGRV